MSSRKLIFAPFILIALGIGLWSAYWFIGAYVTGTAIANWMTRESEHGRRWTCHNQRIGGFPYRFELNCSAVSIEDARVSAKAGALRATAMAFRPNHVIAEIDGPAEATLASGQRFAATWTSARSSTIISGGRLQSYDSVLEGFRAVEISANGQAAIAQAASLETHLRQNPASTPDNATFDLAIDGKGVSSPLVDALLRSSDPGDLTLRASATRADAIGAGHPIDNLERWRLSGGKLSISQLKIMRGRIMVDAAGEFMIDDERMIAGRVEGSAAGVEQFLPRGAGALGGLLSGGGKALPFALNFRDGRVMMGPLRLATLPPLY